LIIDFEIIVNHLIYFSKVQQDACCEGWTGASCSDPICTIACVNGQCVAPDQCSCNSGYAGEACQYTLSMRF
jgi:hypothetical protein